MTTDKTPTPEELEALARKHGATSYRNRADTQHPAYGFTEDGLRSLLADALAKWGQPAQAGEPFGYVHQLPSGSEVFARTRDFYPNAVPVFTTPQPTQPQARAVPLTPDQIAEIADAAHREYDRLVSSGQCAPRWSAVFAHLLEMHHGIKGGQHDAGKTGLQQLNTTEPLEALRYRLLREAERGVQCAVSEADALEFRRDQYGVSQRDFAEIIGIMPSHYSEVARGKRRLPINAVARAVAVGVPVAALLQGRAKPGPRQKGGQHGTESST